MPQVAAPSGRGRGRGRGVVASGAAPGAWEVDRSDSDECELQASGGALNEVQGRLFKQYIEACDELPGSDVEGGDSVFAQGLSRVAEWAAAGARNAMCLICLGSIKPAEAVWHCSNSCFAVFHLPCMQDWARNQLDAAALRAANAASGAQAVPRAALAFGCPKCRCEYPAARVPRAYLCFCGKVESPTWDPWVAPHTCGELCGRALPSVCGHTCRLLCHGGPCPPCPLAVDTACYCGKRSQRRRCGQQHFACGGVCGRRLECGHTCGSACHPGDCPPCPQVGSFRCRCGAVARTTTCADRAWACARPCGKALACGRHRCERVCCPGPCGACPVGLQRTCPCGKLAYGELRCDEPAPSCGGTCGKPLACGRHSCQERCHEGACTTVCRELVTKRCRCGRTSKELICSSELLCELRCTNMRSCARHACRRRCCDGSCPPCEEACGRRLGCSNHKCPAPCHTGACRPCPLTFSVSCACGRTKHTLPCGAEPKAVPPRCPHACPVPATCRHAADRRPHRCHFGPCPPCRAPCGAQLACGHGCEAARCHDRAPPAVADWQQPKPTRAPLQSTTAPATSGSSKRREQQSSGGGDSCVGSGNGGAPPEPPALLAAAAAEASGGITSCPPCVAPVTLPCLGGHCVGSFPCCHSAPGPCPAPCGRPLACGNHTCSKPCHVLTPEVLAAAGVSESSGFVPGAAADAARRLPGAAAACDACTRPCGKQHACGHACSLQCHAGGCPDCTVAVQQACCCGKGTRGFACHELQRLRAAADSGSAAERARAAAALSCGKPCHRALPGCQHPCRTPCHPGACDDGSCAEAVTVRCECRRRKEKWECARVRDALRAGGGDGVYDSGRLSLKLLACDAECRAQAAEKKGSAPAASAAATDGGCQQGRGVSDGGGGQTTGADGGGAKGAAPAPAAAAAAASHAAAGSKGAKRMSREERARLAAERAEQQLAEERRRKRMQMLLPVAAASLVVVLCLWGLLLLRRVLMGGGAGGGDAEL